MSILMCSAPAFAGTTRALDRDEVIERLHAMWVAENIANHTGLTTEGAYKDPPFLTDEAWGTNAGSNGQLIDYVFLDPWPADDDTDIEYVYLHLMRQHRPLLTASEIRDGWIAHINDYIWVSNERARALLGAGVLPPVTGSTGANRFALRIDAQLTTEMFGAVAPGMAATALELADLPIRTTSSGYATHAAQFHVALYSAAILSDAALPLDERILALVSQARSIIPDTSKSADICDYVLADFLDNPDPDDWERTRDRVHTRYQLLLPDAHHGFPDPAALGFRYRAWTESSVNFATGLIALLYGGGDLARTIRIGTLSGWDSDNGTATMGGLIGLLRGEAAVLESFPGATISDRYDIFRTRDGLPTWIPDPDAQDTFTLIAERSADLVERVIEETGGRIDDGRGAWLLPPPHVVSPTALLHARSANLHVRAGGGTVTAACSVTSVPDILYGRDDPDLFAAGSEHDFSGVEPNHGNVERRTFTTHNAGLNPGDPVTLTVEYSMPVEVVEVVFTEDNHYPDGDATDHGGWFESLTLEVRSGGAWTAPTCTQSPALDASIPYQRITFRLDAAQFVDGFRITGPVGGDDAFITGADLDALRPAGIDERPTFDLDGDGAVTPEDLYAWYAAPVDLDGDAAADARDARYLEAAIRWTEWSDILE